MSFQSVPPAFGRAALRALCVATLGAITLVLPATAAEKTTRIKTPSQQTVKTGLENLEKQVQEFTLPNGLRFLLVERHDAPVFSFMTMVGTGSGGEDKLGTTGIAHMMEHMAFKGTALVGTKDYAKEKPLLDAEEAAFQALRHERLKGAQASPDRLKSLEATLKAAQDTARTLVESNGFAKLLEQSGVKDLNAYTSDDVTAYTYSLPSNRFSLWSALEGSRMAYPVFREFYKERDVVFEERRMRYESSPNGRLFLEFVQAAFTAHPYGSGGIGHPSDLKNFTRTEGEEFYKKNYVARNMTCVVVGDVTLADLKKQTMEHFGEVSDAPKPEPVATQEPEQRAERRVILEDVAQPIVFIGYHIPGVTDPTYKSYQALADLIGGGEYSRLYKALVKEKKLAVNIGAQTGFPGDRDPNLLFLYAVPAAGVDPNKLESEIYTVLDEVARKPFTDEELSGFKVRTRANLVNASEANESLASGLAYAVTFQSDWKQYFRDAEQVQTLKVEDVMAAMARAVRKNNRTVGMIVHKDPSSEPKAEKGGQ